MSRVVFCLLCIVLWSGAATAQRSDENDRMWFRVSVEPEFVLTKGAHVGGQIVMDVRFVSLDPVKRLRLEMPQIEGAQTETLIRPATRQVTIDVDDGYSILSEEGYSHGTRIAIMPRQAGTLVIPPIRVTGISAPQGALSFPFEEIFPQRLITVHAPSAQFDDGVWLVSRAVTIEEFWTPAITEIRAGDTVRRRVTVSVDGVEAGDLPDLTLASSDGYRVLSTELSRETEKTETGFVAHVDQTWDIYVETEQVIHVEPIRLAYWNPETAKSEIAGVPRQRVEPLPRDAVELRDQVRAQVLAEHRAKQLGLTVLLWLPLAAVGVVFALILWRLLPSRADVNFWNATRQTVSPVELYGLFLTWKRQSFGQPATGTDDPVSALEPQAVDQVGRLNRSIFSRQGGAVDTARAAGILIWASRWAAVKRFAASLAPGVARFLFLR